MIQEIRNSLISRGWTTREVLAEEVGKKTGQSPNKPSLQWIGKKLVLNSVGDKDGHDRGWVRDWVHHRCGLRLIQTSEYPPSPHSSSSWWDLGVMYKAWYHVLLHPLNLWWLSARGTFTVTGGVTGSFTPHVQHSWPIQKRQTNKNGSSQNGLEFEKKKGVKSLGGFSLSLTTFHPVTVTCTNTTRKNTAKPVCKDNTLRRCGAKIKIKKMSSQCFVPL